MRIEPHPNMEMNKDECKALVFDVVTGHWHQHHYKIWKDRYCELHHPENVKARREAAKKRQQRKDIA